MTSSRNPETFTVALDAGQPVTALHYAAAAPASGAALIVAHGAGAGQYSPWIVAFARDIAALGFDVVTFNFLYTEQKRRVPDRAPALEGCYLAVLESVRTHIDSARACLFIGGKSMGGRMATQLAASRADLPVAGLVLLGYPLHPPGQPGKRRDAHLPSVRRPMLVIQGSRDTFGTPEEIRPAFEPLDPPAAVHVIDGGDHSFKIARAGKGLQSAIDDEVRKTAAAWMRRIIESR